MYSSGALMKIFEYTPGKLTWNLKSPNLQEEILFQPSIFGFHVNFPGCKWWNDETFEPF